MRPSKTFNYRVTLRNNDVIYNCDDIWNTYLFKTYKKMSSIINSLINIKNKIDALHSNETARINNPQLDISPLLPDNENVTISIFDESNISSRRIDFGKNLFLKTKRELELLDEVDGLKREIDEQKEEMLEKVKEQKEKLEQVKRNYKRSCNRMYKALKTKCEETEKSNHILKNEYENMKRFLTRELFNARSEAFDIKFDLKLAEDENKKLREEKAELRDMYNKVKVSDNIKFRAKETDAGWFPEFYNGHTNKVVTSTCICCLGERVSVTNICCNMGLCHDCFITADYRKVGKIINEVEIRYGLNCNICGKILDLLNE